jgi:hypothetical protein
MSKGFEGHPTRKPCVGQPRCDTRCFIRGREGMWVREFMLAALMGIGKRNKKLNKAAIRAAKSIGPVDVDYGDDNSCESTGVLEHLTSYYYLREKFAR